MNKRPVRPVGSPSMNWSLCWDSLPDVLPEILQSPGLAYAFESLSAFAHAAPTPEMPFSAFPI